MDIFLVHGFLRICGFLKNQGGIILKLGICFIRLRNYPNEIVKSKNIWKFIFQIFTRG